MQTKLPWLCAALLGVIGWLVGYSMNTRPAGSSPNIAATTGNSASADSSATPAANPETAAMVKDFEQFAATIMEDGNYLRRSHRLYRMVEHLTAAEMPGALNAAMHLDSQERYEFVRGLIEHWTELDPRAAVEYASALFKETQIERPRSCALAIWADKDFAAASQYVLAMTPGRDRNDVLGEIATDFAKKNPVAALRFIDENLKDTMTNHGVNIQSMIVKQWARTDFDAATKYVLAIKDREVRRNALDNLAYSEVNKSPQDLLNWAKQLPNRETREHLTRSVLSDWTRKDPQAVLQYSRTLRPGDLQENVVSSAVSALASRDLVEAHRAVEMFPEGSVRSRAICSLAVAWLERDSKAATEYVKTLPEGSTRTEAIAQIARQLAEKDPHAALEVVNLLPDPDEYNNAIQQIAGGWSHVDPKSAANYFLNNRVDRYDSDDSSALWSVLTSWASSAPQEVLAWGAKLPDGKDKNWAVSIALDRIAANDPEAAAAATLNLSDDARANVIARVADNWAEYDPKAASNWAATLPEGDVRGNAFTSIINRWTDVDAVASAKWLGTLAAGKSRDFAVRAFSDRITERDPEGAVQWAATISDESTRCGALERVAGNWMTNDKAAASAWVQSTDLLPDESRQRLLGTGKK